MAGNLISRLCAASVLSIAFIALAGGNTLRSVPQAVTPSPDGVSQVAHALVGKRITVHGKLSLRGKIAPAYVVLDNHQTVYLRASWGWGATYSEWEGKRVAATGTLRFYHATPAEPTDRPAARLPDHFYFEAKNTEVRLVRR